MTINALRYLPAPVGPENIATVVGLVSDTHYPQRCRQLPPFLFDVLRGVDLILHAAVTPAEFQAVRAAIADLAHRCWTGEVSILDRDLVRDHLQQNAGLSLELRSKLQALMDEDG